MWSVAAEFHLYLCFPLLLWLCTSAAWWSLLAVYGVVYGSIALLTPYAGAEFPTAYLGLIAHFYAGIWACRQRMRAARPGRFHATAPGIALLVVLIVLSVALGFEASEHWLAYLDVLCATGTVLLIWGLTVRHARAGRVRAPGMWHSVGEYSYSLYLTHAPVVFVLWSFVRASMNSPQWIWVLLGVVCPPVCMGLARLFHRCFEQPFVYRLRPAQACAAKLNQ
jgi:peptidoglycan/LPS O-acetylase OafA/YrhL